MFPRSISWEDLGSDGDARGGYLTFTVLVPIAGELHSFDGGANAEPPPEGVLQELPKKL